MPMTPAEKMRAYRQRQREKIAQLEQAAGGNVTVTAPAGNVTEKVHAAELDRIRAEIRAAVDTWPAAQQRRFDELAGKIDRLMDAAWRDYLVREHEEVAAELARLREASDRAHKEHMRYLTIVKGVKAQLSHEDYRYLLGVLHPDREPTPEKRAKAFDIVRKLEPYIEAAKR